MSENEHVAFDTELCASNPESETKAAPDPVKTAREALDFEEALRLCEIGEYLYSAKAYSYGDGYTEPREYGIEWQWQQSKPNEYGQGVLLAEAAKWHEQQAEDGTLTEAAKLRAALARAMQEAMFAQSGEPVAWRYRYNGCWYVTDSEAQAKQGFDVVPLYAAPPAKAEVRVKPLVWDDVIASTPFCTYSVGPTADDQWAWTRTEYPYGDTSDPLPTEADAKAAAQADYDQRIRSALVEDEVKNAPADCCGKPIHDGDPEKYVLACCGKPTTPAPGAPDELVELDKMESLVEAIHDKFGLASSGKRLAEKLRAATMSIADYSTRSLLSEAIGWITRALRDIQSAEHDAWRARESETQEALQKISEEFGVHGGEPRVDGVRRILGEMCDRIEADATEKAAKDAEIAELEKALRYSLSWLNEHKLSVKEVQSIVTNYPTIRAALAKQEGE